MDDAAVAKPNQLMSYILLAKKDHTALKEHVCIWCPEAICPGTKYTVEASIYDGDFQHQKWHPECWEASRMRASEQPGCNFEWAFRANTHKRGSTLQA